MKSGLRLISLLNILALLAWVSVTIPAAPLTIQAQGPEIGQPESESAEIVSLFWHPAVGDTRGLGTQPIEPSQMGLSSAEMQDAKRVTLAFLERFSTQLQANAENTSWDPFRSTIKDTESHVYLGQVYQGVPVFAGEMAVHLKDGAVVAANGEYLGRVGVSVKPALSVRAALKQALAKIDLSGPSLLEDRLVIYNPALLDAGPSENHLAYQLTVGSQETADSYVVLVDAHSGKVLLTYSELQTAKNRQIHDLNGSTNLPGSLCYTEAGPQGSASADCVTAFNFTGDTYDYYAITHGRDSFDNRGATMVASVRYGTSANAFWNGRQTAFGPGFATKDVVAHEWTHAVTAYTADLVYAYQSGALNEAMSDVFGAMIDRDDWTMGEDTPLGVLRSLQDPNAYGNPARVGDNLFYCGSDDNGGVHTNSTVPSHAAYWMTQGGTFNGQTMSAIGRNRTERVFYRALSVYLTSGSNFSDARNALNSSCADIYGGGSETCTSVDRATRAVEMDQPVCGSEPASPDAYEEDDSYVQASSIATDGTAQTHNFHDAGDNDWVRFDATSGCSYVIETSSLGTGSDTVTYLYGADGQTELAYDDDGGEGRASRIAWTASTGGRHYVRVRHYSSSAQGENTNYDLSVTTGTCNAGGDSYEPDDTRGAAKPITVNGDAQNHNFHVAGDNDWVRFTARANAPHVIETSNLGSRCDTYVYLYDANGTLITEDDDGGIGLASRIEWTPASAGDFYVRVRHESVAVFGRDTDYSLQVTVESASVDRYEVDDSPAQATTIAVGNTQADHTFHDAGDEDWIRFSATARCSYVIDTLNLGERSDTYMYLYDTDGSTEITHDDDGGPGYASSIAWTALAGGSYYVRVRHYNSSSYGEGTDYDLRVQRTGCNFEGDEYEDDDVVSRASNLVPNGTAQRHNFHDAGDQDWVRFAASVGVEYVIETSDLESNCDTYLYLYGTDGRTEITYDDDGGEGLASRIAWTAPRDGIYYVRVRHYRAGAFGELTGYQLSVVGRGEGGADPYEDDDVAGRASLILGVQAGHNFHDAGDKDWGRFLAIAGTSYVIETLNLEGRCDTYLELYGPDGSTRLQSDNDSGTGLASRIDWTAPSNGTYFVRVRHVSNQVYGANTGYDLRVSSGPAGADIYEPDDNAASARRIRPNLEIQTHNFHVSGDNDWVWFEATAGGTYVMETFNLGPLSDTVMYLYQPDGQTIITSNDDGGMGYASRITWTSVAAGRYYIRVRQYGNSTYGRRTNYDLGVFGLDSSADQYEPDNIFLQASEIVVDGAAQSHNFHVAGDNDWVRFDATMGGEYEIETFDLCSQSDTYIYLYDTDGTSVIAYNDDGGAGLASRIEWTAPVAGTFYVRVRHYSSVAFGSDTCYSLQVGGQDPFGGDAFEPDNVYDRASRLAVNGDSQRHNFHVFDDRDWIRFTATGACAYVIDTFNLGSRSDTYLELYDRDGTTLLESDDDGGDGLASRIEWTVQSDGTYYAMVRHYAANQFGQGTEYSVRVTGACSSGEDAYEPDDEYTVARFISQNGAPQRHNFHRGGDQDWVRFNVAAGTECTIETSNLGTLGDTVLDLYGSDGRTVLASDDDGGTGYASLIQWTAPADGRYYVRVHHYLAHIFGDATSYDLAVSCGAAVVTDEPEEALPHAGSLATIELPVATAREGEEIEAVVRVNQEAQAIKVETLAKPSYLRLIEATPLLIDGSPVDGSALDAAVDYPERWQVATAEDGLASVWYSGKGEWDGQAVYPVLRLRWRLVEPLPAQVAIPFVVTVVDQNGLARTETLYGTIQPQVSDPKIDAVMPLSVYGGADTEITIQGSDFVDTPKVYLRAGVDSFGLANVQFLSDEANEVQLLQATVLAGTKSGVYKLVVENPDGGSAEFESVEVTDQAVYGLTVVPSARNLRGPAGTTAVCALHIINEGNTLDAFDIVVSGYRWPTHAPIRTQPVQAGADTYANVSVAIPAGTPNGASDSATVTVISQGDPGQSYSFTLTTTAADEYKIYLPISMRN